MKYVVAVLYDGIPRMVEHNGYTTRDLTLKSYVMLTENICGFCVIVRITSERFPH